MPRYYFHWDDSDDEEGTELPDDAAATREAIQTFGQMIRDGGIKTGGAMKVADCS
jgi:hypothetical protein